MSGFGNQPYGSSPYGIGTPITATAPGGAVLRETSTGSSLGSRLINAETRDYVVDENGRIVGMSDVQQLMQIALGTVKGSSAMLGLGHALATLDVITDNVERRVATIVDDAVLHLTSRKLVEILSVVTTRMHAGALHIVVRWRDLTTGLEQKSEI